MLPAADIAAYAVVAGAVGSLLLRIDSWAHSPAALEERLKAVEKRLEKGDERLSERNTKLTVKMDAFDRRLVRLETVEELRANSSWPNVNHRDND